MAEYEKVKPITIPLKDSSHLLLITTEVNADHGRIIQQVLKLAKHSGQMRSTNGRYRRPNPTEGHSY
jgi:hypothetical protein